MSTTKKVSLLNFRITDYKGIQVLEKEVNGKHFLICGHNGAGKTSVTETINRSALRIDPKEMADIPIRLGAKNATFSHTYGVEEDGVKTKYLIRTVVRPSGTEMTILNMENNMEEKPPVTKIREILGDSFDMQPILDKKGKEQIDFLFKALGGSDTFDNTLNEIKKKKEQKASNNIRIKDAKDAMNRVYPGHQELMDFRIQGKYSEEQELPVKENRAVAIQMEKMAAERKNEENARAVTSLFNIENDILDLESKLEALKNRREVGKQWLKDNPVIDLAPFNERIAAVEDEAKDFDDKVAEIKKSNELYKKIKDYLVKEEELMGLEKVSKDYDAEIVEFKANMRKALADLKLEDIVPGLDLVVEDDNEEEKAIGVYYGGLPLNRRQISYGKGIVVLAKLSSYVNGGKFNFIHLKEWNELDKKSKKEVLDFAKNNPDLNIQFGIEEVTDTVLGVNIIEDKE